MKIKKKVGLFGGAFNPIHNSHISISRYLIKKNIVDEVWIIPCKKHAFDKELADSEDRIAMINLAVKNKRIRICRIEIHYNGKNYTLKTLRKLRKKYPYEFLLVHGSDIFAEIKRWNDYNQLFKEAEFIIFKRKNYSLRKIKGMKIINVLEYNIASRSSTEIRKKIKEGKSISNLVPKSVAKYITSKRLYK